MNSIHLSFGDSASGNIKSSLRERNSIKNMICIRDDFSIGPIRGLETNEGIQERTMWMRELLRCTALSSHADYSDWIETYINSNLDIAAQIPDNSSIIVWHGQSASDRIGLRYILYMLQNKSLQVEEVNLPINAGAATSEMIVDGFHTKKSIVNIQHLLKEWEAWSQTNSILRIMQGEEVRSVPDSYFDELIVKHVTSEYKKATHTIGEILSDNQINEFYLTSRIHQLVKLNKLEYIGNLSSYREFEIRLAH